MVAPENERFEHCFAGAVCPKCGEMDKLVMFRDENQTRRECVNCGYQDSLEDGFTQEIPTRVTAKPKINQVDVQPLKFFRPPK